MSVQAVQEATASLMQSLQRDFGEAFVNRGKEADVFRLSEIDAQDIEWVWNRWIPARTLTILGGDSKSTVMASLIAAWTTGGILPDGAKARRMNVLMLSAEDDPSFVVRPRLEQHGADARRVFVLKGTSTGSGETRRFDLRWDIDVMRQVIRKRRVGMVVIDPLSHYVSTQTRKSDDDTRKAIALLAGLATETGVAVVGILHDDAMDGEGLAPQRGLGVHAFTDLARSVLVIADQPDDCQPEKSAADGRLKVMQVVRSNHSIPPPPLAFRRPLDAPITWLGETDVTIADCLAAPSARQRRRVAMEHGDAVDFLGEVLANGPVPSVEILPQARAQGFSERTLRRAKKHLGVLALRDGTLGLWKWELPVEATDALSRTDTRVPAAEHSSPP